MSTFHPTSSRPSIGAQRMDIPGSHSSTPHTIVLIFRRRFRAFSSSSIPLLDFHIPFQHSILCSAAAPALAQLFHLLLHATFAEMTTGTITTAKSAMPSSTPTLAIKRTAKSQQPPTKSCSSSSAMHPRRRPTKFAASSIIALASLLAVTLLLLTGTPEGAEARILPEPMTANGLEQSGGWRTWHQQPQSSHEESAEADAEEAESLPQRGKEKRRLVVRVPFAQNPDGLQLSRIYKSLFEPSNSRAKKQPWTYSLRHFVQQQGDDEAN